MAKGISAYATLSDRQIVTAIKSAPGTTYAADLTYALYCRYNNFVHKHWHALSRALNASHLVQDVKDDFYSESYVSFTKALNAIDITKIQNNNWKFLGYFGFYLSNQRKTFAKHIIQKYHVETPLEVPEASGTGGDKTVLLSDIVDAGTVSSAEDTFIEDDSRRRFWSGLSYCKEEVWGDIEKYIFEMREKGESIRTICGKLDMSPWKYNKILDSMKQQLERAIESA
jgi:hypothetical protein